MSILHTLRSDGSIIVNKNLSFVLGLEATILYSELLSKEFYFEKNKKLDDEQMFFSTVIDLEYSTTLSKKQQLKAIKALEAIGLIEVKLKGLPAKRHFKIKKEKETLDKLYKIIEIGEDIKEARKERLNIMNDKDKERLANWLVSKETTRCAKREQLDRSKGNVNNTNYNNTNIINNTIEQKEIEKQVEKLYLDYYPLKKGKAKGIKKALSAIKNKKITLYELEICIKNYAEEVKDRDKKYIKHFSTFMNGDYIDYLNVEKEEEMKEQEKIKYLNYGDLKI
ncbi:MAG: hypothetical protein PWP15_1136 [Methanothermococcus sp.]|uniref:hypothetical protein n=1 Tax=Methanothermococcus sp. TaxID=2614238 RepID=UPI00258D428B|nr:hypothetical protein [Methanothermococcus sp.]MDK2790629.1 hypothetical protein [Methanothermococcus sp.]